MTAVRYSFTVYGTVRRSGRGTGLAGVHEKATVRAVVHGADGARGSVRRMGRVETQPQLWPGCCWPLTCKDEDGFLKHSLSKVYTAIDGGRPGWGVDRVKLSFFLFGVFVCTYVVVWDVFDVGPLSRLTELGFLVPLLRKSHMVQIWVDRVDRAFEGSRGESKPRSSNFGISWSGSCCTRCEAGPDVDELVIIGWVQSCHPDMSESQT